MISGFSEPLWILYSGFGAMIYIFVALLHHFHHFYYKYASTPLLFFWLGESLMNVLVSRTAITRNLMNSNFYYFVSLVAAVVVSFSLFVLENIPKAKSEYQSLYDANENVTLEESANIFSRLVFHWMSPIMKLGYSKG